jgi:DNA polymerase III delta prime subunit
MRLNISSGLSSKLRDEFISLIRNTAPVLLAFGSGGLVIFVPMLILILGEIIDNFSTWTVAKDKTSQLTIVENRGFENSNQNYDRLSWFVRKNIKFNTLSLIQNSTLYNGIEQVPLYCIDSTEPVDYTFNGELINISFSKKEETDETSRRGTALSIILKSKNIQLMMDFVDYCSAEYLKDQKKQQFKLTTSTYNQGRWDSTPIRVMKTEKNIFLDKETSKELFSLIEAFKENETFCKDAGVSYKLGLLFYGHPGCGKTSSIYCLANQNQYCIYKLPLAQIKTADTLRTLVKFIPENSIVVVEDIDCVPIAQSRDQILQDTSEVVMRTAETDVSKPRYEIGHISKLGTPKLDEKELTLADVLDILDGNEFLHRNIIIFTTNHPHRLDKALVRPGRIDHKIEFKPAKKAVIRDIFEFFYKNNEFLQPTLEKIDNLPDDFTIPQSDLINTIIVPRREKCEEAFNVMFNNKLY